MSRALKCSFCGKRETEVAKLVAGTGGRGPRPSVYICDRCVAKASDIMAEADQEGLVTGGTPDNAWDES